jgi:hypothetical protein
MNEDSDWWDGPGNDNTPSNQGEESNKGDGMANGGGAATAHALPYGRNDIPPNYCFAEDALAVVKKANDIAVALNHAERTMAHVIAGMALRADTANRLNKCRLNGGTMSFGGSVTSLSSERALQACLRFMQERIKSQSEEQSADLPFSQDAHEVFVQAEALANARSAELRKIEVGDILRALTEGESFSNLRPLLHGLPTLSLNDIAQELRRLHHSITEVKTFGDGPSAADILSQLRPTIDAHLLKYDDVVAAADYTRSSMAVQPSTFTDATVADHVRSVVPASSTIKLRSLASTLEVVRAKADENSRKLDQANSAIAALQKTCSMLLLVTAISVLGVVLLVGNVIYRAVT